MKLKHPKRLWVSLALLVILSIPPFLHSFRLIPSLNLLFFNFSHSAPKGVYIAAWDQEIRAGDYLVMTPPEIIKSYLYGRQWTTSKYLLKRVAAQEGEPYSIADNWLLMNGKRAYIYEVDPDNLPLLRPQNGNYVVPEGQLLLVSWTVPSSFDSRYFGPIDKDLIHRKVSPLIVVPDWLEKIF